MSKKVHVYHIRLELSTFEYELARVLLSELQMPIRRPIGEGSVTLKELTLVLEEREGDR